MASRFVYNRAFDAYVGSAPLMRAFMEGIGKEATNLAQNYAPVRLGWLRDSIELEMRLERARWIARVKATDFKWRFHEFGTYKMAATPFLRPALAAVASGVEGV